VPNEKQSRSVFGIPVLVRSQHEQASGSTGFAVLRVVVAGFHFAKNCVVEIRLTTFLLSKSRRYPDPHSSAENLIKMNQTLSEKLCDSTEESSAPQSPSTSSKPKTSISSKAGDKKQETDKSSTETPEENAQRLKEKRNKKEKDSKVRKGVDKAEQQQKLDIAEKVICTSFSSENVPQAADIDSNWSDDDSMDVSTMMDLHYGQQGKSTRQYQQEDLDGSLTKDYANVSTPEMISRNEKETLVCMVKTLRRRLEEVESENRQLNEKNSACNAQLEEQIAYREELNGVQKELEQLRCERDRAIYRAGELTIESGKVSESYDRVAESKVVIEQMRRMLQISLTQQSSSAHVCSVSKKMDRRSGVSTSFSSSPISLGFRKLGSLLRFRNKYDDKTVVSTYDDDCILDPTEDNTSVGSEDIFYLEPTEFAEQPSVAFFIDNLNCSSDQLRNRRLLNVGLNLDPPKNKK
jgi:hypothetical protein